MNPRSIRRAAERKATKRRPQNRPSHRTLDHLEPAQPAAAIAAKLAAPPIPPTPSSPPDRALRKAKPNRLINARLATGLTGRTVLLPSDDVAAYRQHVQDFAAEFQPVGPRESELVQALADHSWRLTRIASLEMAIYAYGHEQFAEQFADRGELQAGFTQMHTFLHYEKQLRNLQIQESRIRRNREKDTAELLRLQQERADATTRQEARCDTHSGDGRRTRSSKSRKPPPRARAVGFDFAFPNEVRRNRRLLP